MSLTLITSLKHSYHFLQLLSTDILVERCADRCIQKKKRPVTTIENSSFGFYAVSHLFVTTTFPSKNYHSIHMILPSCIILHTSRYNFSSCLCHSTFLCVSIWNFYSSSMASSSHSTLLACYHLSSLALIVKLVRL